VNYLARSQGHRSLSAEVPSLSEAQTDSGTRSGIE